MITIETFRGEYTEAIRKMDPEMAEEILCHGDIDRENVILVLSDGIFAGAGYLRGTSSSRLLSSRKQLPVYYLTAVFSAVPGSETEAEASAELLAALTDRFEALRAEYPKKHLSLVLWCGCAKTAYESFLLSFGFRIEAVMPVMKKTLSEPEKTAAKLPEGFRFVKPEFTDEFAKEYFRMTGKCFGIPDSEAELRYRLSHGGKLRCVFKKEKLIASVTTWPMGDDTYATENIFCHPSYRNRGITAALLSETLEELRAAGAKAASLSLFGDNVPAYCLYAKLGYEIRENLLELRYDPEGEMRKY